MFSSRNDAADQAGVCNPLKRWTVVLPLVLLSALPVIGPLAPDLQAHDLARICQLAILAMSAVAALAALIVRPDLVDTAIRRPLAVVLLALAAVAGASVMNASQLQPALLELSILGSLVLLAVVFASLFAGTDRTGMALVVPVVASGLLSFMILVRYTASIGSDAAVLREHLIPGYSNYRFLNHVQVVTIPLIAAFVMRGDFSRRARALALVVLAFEFCWLVFTGGRAAMLALAIGALVACAFYRWKSRHWLVVVGASGAIGVALFFVLFVVLPGYSAATIDYTAIDTISRSSIDAGQSRRILWTVAIEYIRESPWLGIGPMHFAGRINPEAAHPHNIYLQIAAEWGLPMLAVMLVIAALGLRRLICATQRSDSLEEATLGVGLTAACVAVAVDGMFSGNFVMPNSQLWIAFALGLAAAYVIGIEGRAASARGVQPQDRTYDLRWPLIVLVVILQAALWQGVWPEILDVPAHVDRVRAEVVANWRDNPRIWSHGWFR